MNTPDSIFVLVGASVYFGRDAGHALLLCWSCVTRRLVDRARRHGVAGSIVQLLATDVVSG
ncbi:hypothetical protein [Antrihabitans spumae]|uniref:Uncharacterized protein n=1 Tax=Antrihabitans spumae TaxID=3373370 RepID=A0ABW7JJ39_9NOCA